MQSKREALEALRELIREVGIPGHMHTDSTKEMMLGNWKKIYQEYGIKMTHTEKVSPWQNCAETEIRELKKHARRLLHKTRAPLQLWDFCLTYVTELKNRIVRASCRIPRQNTI